MRKFFSIVVALVMSIAMWAQTPEHLYILGNVEGIGWEPGASAEMTKSGDTFTGTYTFTSATSYFAFTTVQGSWDVVNANRWGSPHLVNDAAPVALISSATQNEPCCTIDQGTYEITVDWANMTVKAHKDVPPVVIAGPALWPAAAVLPTAIPEEVRVLSLNNSLIHYENEWQDDIFNKMAAAMGKNAVWTAHTNLGKSLKYHYDEGEGMTEAGTPSARKLIRDNAYTHIILQEQTAKPRTDFAGFRESVITWVEYIRANGANPNPVIILPLNWAYGNSSAFAAENAQFLQNYLDLAQELGLVISPVGKAYDLAAAAEGVSIMAAGGRWFKDDRHPTQMTTYLGACLEYATIFGVDPTTITWAPTTVTGDEAAKMRNYAKEALTAVKQPVNAINKTIRFEVRQLDVNGLSVATLKATSYTGAELTDSIFTATAAGTYTVNATYDEKTLAATVKIADMNTVVVKTASIKVNGENKTVAQNFDTMDYPAADATVIEKGVYGNESTLPEGWRIERNQVGPRMIGSYNDATDKVQYQGGYNLPSNASNGTWNLGANGSSDRAIGGMTTGVANGARAINIMTHLENNGTTDFEKINISYDIEKYRDGSNANLFYVKLFTSSNGAVWNEAGETFTFLNPAGSGQNGFTTLPGATTHIEGTLKYNFQPGTDLYLCWAISTSSGDNCASAPCLAIDNVNLEFVEPAIPVYPHYIYVDDRTGWATLGLYAYGDADLYGAWPGAAKIGETDIDGTTYKVYPLPITTNGTYNLIFNNWNNGSQTPSPDYVINEARDYVLVVTATSITDAGVTPPTHEDPQAPDYEGIEFSESAATYTQNFNTLPAPASDATLIDGLNGVYGLGSTLPLGWRAARVETAPRTIGAYANAVDTLQYQGGVSLPSNAKNGTWNLGMNGSDDRAVGGMTTDAAGGARTINIMAYVKNVGIRDIASLSISYNVEKYRDGSNANEFYVKLFTSVDGVSWTAVENADFNFLNPKGSAQTGFATVPASSTAISGTLNESIAAGAWLHICWQIATSTGTVCQAAPCLAIDDVVITANYDTTTTLETVAPAANVRKNLVNGQLLIIRDGKTYNAQGMMVK